MTGGTSERRTRERRGRMSEFVAAAALMAKGYRILARRYKTRAGEIDLVAARGKRLAFVEVKMRRTFPDCEAAIGPRQRWRIRQAAGFWLGRHPRYAEHDQAFDLVFLAPWRWPRHLENAL